MHVQPAPSILFEDDALLAVGKPEGLSSIPESDVAAPSVLSVLSAQQDAKLYIVHRLDKEVSGVILFAKTADAHRTLCEQFASRAVHKTYLALVHGVVASDAGTMDMPLREFGSGRMGVDPLAGKSSLTEFRTVRRFARLSLMEASPQTGRRHQIRVHFYSIGHPIVGDVRYGDRAMQARFPRLMLHARRIEFTHPSGQRIAVESPAPDTFRAALRTLAEESLTGLVL
jgi:tRNA pseudouridine32 synthase / 23S rRNA pseudouridine746 synthase